MTPPLEISDPVRHALDTGKPVVALESTLIAHGLPRPDNIETAFEMESAVISAGAFPATIALLDGKIRVGLHHSDIEILSTADGVAKVSRDGLAAILAAGGPGATTVAGTMICAAMAGIPVLATGGIGGVHRGGGGSLDISADLLELGRTPVAVVCSGAKTILDLPKTLEVLETEGVPVIGFGTTEFHGFYTQDTGLELEQTVASPVEAAGAIAAQRRLGLSAGLVIANPTPSASAIDGKELESWIEAALADARLDGIKGKAVTPYLLSRLFEISGGRTLEVNKALLVANARLGAEIAVALAQAG